MWRTCCVCVWERTKHIICHLIGLKQCRGRMPHCRAAQMNEKYVNASCEVHRVHCHTDNRQMVKYPVWSKSVQASSQLWINWNVSHTNGTLHYCLPNICTFPAQKWNHKCVKNSNSMWADGEIVGRWVFLDSNMLSCNLPLCGVCFRCTTMRVVLSLLFELVYFSKCQMISLIWWHGTYCSLFLFWFIRCLLQI